MGWPTPPPQNHVRRAAAQAPERHFMEELGSGAAMAFSHTTSRLEEVPRKKRHPISHPWLQGIVKPRPDHALDSKGIHGMPPSAPWQIFLHKLRREAKCSLFVVLFIFAGIPLWGETTPQSPSMIHPQVSEVIQTRDSGHLVCGDLEAVRWIAASIKRFQVGVRRTSNHSKLEWKVWYFQIDIQQITKERYFFSLAKHTSLGTPRMQPSSKL
jgi:hypothetical protein